MKANWSLKSIMKLAFIRFFASTEYHVVDCCCLLLHLFVASACFDEHSYLKLNNSNTQDTIKSLEDRHATLFRTNYCRGFCRGFCHYADSLL